MSIRFSVRLTRTRRDLISGDGGNPEFWLHGKTKPVNNVRIDLIGLGADQFALGKPRDPSRIDNADYTARFMKKDGWAGRQP
jgi:hypothetical protein